MAVLGTDWNGMDLRREVGIFLINLTVIMQLDRVILQLTDIFLSDSTAFTSKLFVK